MTDTGQLGGLLRAWRNRTAPGNVGLPDGQRRTPGLRREELAALAGLSVDYIVRLEQGRATRPSAQVVSGLARALRLSEDETSVLRRAAGLIPSANGVERDVPPGIKRIASRLEGLPVAIYSADWWLLWWNSRWTALMGDPPAATGRDRNLVWNIFTTEVWRPIPVDLSPDEFRQTLVGDLRIALVEHPSDALLIDLVAALRRHSPLFFRQWAEGGTTQHHCARKIVRHPRAGDLLLDNDVLHVHGSGLRLMVYSAAPGTEDATRLNLLAPATHVAGDLGIGMAAATPLSGAEPRPAD